jgi:hypothetical protein
MTFLLLLLPQEREPRTQDGPGLPRSRLNQGPERDWAKGGHQVGGQLSPRRLRKLARKGQGQVPLYTATGEQTR